MRLMIKLNQRVFQTCNVKLVCEYYSLINFVTENDLICHICFPKSGPTSSTLNLCDTFDFISNRCKFPKIKIT